MSGPLGSNEIEDVVSSVRRLVSTDHRPRPVSRDAAQDRLLLTPSLRVVAPAKENGPLILGDPDRTDGTNPAADADTGFSSSLESRLHLVDAEWEDEIWSEPETRLAELALGAEEAELVSAETAAAEPKPVKADVRKADVRKAEVEAPMIEVDSWEPSEPDSVEEPPIPFAAFVPGKEARTTSPSGDAEAAADTPMSDPDRAAEGEVDVAGMLAAAVLEDESLRVMDEEELHALIRTMVREELQGSLGERITRNVRKLVRAEINRALAAQSLD